MYAALYRDLPWWASWLAKRRRDRFYEKRSNDLGLGRDEYRLTRFPGAAAPVVTGYFVDGTTGSNGNGGQSEGDAWATLAYAVANAPGGSTVYVRSGTYSGFTFSRTLTEGTRLTFRAYPGDTMPIISQSTAWPVTISQPWFTLDGFKITNQRHSQWSAAIRITSSLNSTDSVIVSNCVMNDCMSYGVKLENARGVSLIGNEYYDVDTGVQATGAGSSLRFLGEYFHDLTTMVVHRAGPHGTGDPDRPGTGDRGANAYVLTNVVGQVTITDAIAEGLRAFSSEYLTDGGFLELYESRNVTVTGCIVIDCENFVEAGSGSVTNVCTNIRLYRNVVWSSTERNVLVYQDTGPYGLSGANVTAGDQAPRNANGMLCRMTNSHIYHNTIIDPIDAESGRAFGIGLQASGAFAGGVDGLKVKNNIIRATQGKCIYTAGTIPVTVEIDYNLYQRSGGGTVFSNNGVNYTTLLQIQNGTTFEDNGQVGTITFDDATFAGNNFALDAASAGVDDGVSGLISGDISAIGGGYDIGAVESA
jgi:hypothetical protein